MAKVALFWDESFLWGLIAYDTFQELGIDFELLSSREIRQDMLDGFDILFVPGGWASDKIEALGDKGRKKIRSFVETGGSYLGICGGAGLALSHETGLALAPVSRVPTRVRLPSFSGGISLYPEVSDHPMWQGVPEGSVFHAWWPGQFALENTDDVTVLASYGAPAADSYVTDLPVLPDMDWEVWERNYGINLNPKRIMGEPAVIETRFGQGRVLLSYLHFETPGDDAGHRVLLNILRYLAGGKAITGSLPEIDVKTVKTRSAKDGGKNSSARTTEAVAIADGLKASAEELISFGAKNFLWYQRNDWILQWRRGVRGVEYSTLAAMLRKLSASLAELDDVDEDTIENLRRLQSVSRSFFEDAPKLLLLERDAMGEGPISPLKTGDEQILALRRKLFSESRRCGGLYKETIELADWILLPLLRKELRSAGDSVR
ncbi:MAG: BPL-N domain-containing protein [Thermoleophilia bacterium]